MAKKRIAKEIKQPDFVMRAIGSSIEWIKNNLKACIAGAIVIVLLIAGFFAYSIYESRKDEKIQNLFVQGMQSFREYSTFGKVESLNNAESTFIKIATESGGNTKALAKLYLGRIYYLKGKNEDAIKAYREAQALSKADAIQLLSQKALQGLEKKQ